MLRYYVADYNGVLTELKERLSGHLTTPRDADVWIVWQDCQGSFKDLIRASYSTKCHKPTYVVQHGRAATLDYGPPNNFKLLADKFLCWGKNDFARMASFGYADRTIPVGCPLNSQIASKIPHKEKVVLFVPVNTGKEEPENIAAYYTLLQYKYKQASDVTILNHDTLKNAWGFEGRKGVRFSELSQNCDIIAKLLPWHEQKLYHGNTIMGFQDDPSNNMKVFNLLRNVDVVVGLDEGTTEIFAYGHDVPVIIIDGFTYRQHTSDGKSFVPMDIYRTKGAIHTSLDNLPHVLDVTLQHPENLRPERMEIAELELGLSYGDATSNILKVIKQDAAKDFSLIR